MGKQKANVKQKNDQRDPTSDFMLEAYKHYGDAFLRNEELGDRRVTFFITLTTFVIGGSAYLVTTKEIGTSGDQINLVGFLVILFGLPALFLFGCNTLQRIVKRNIATDQYIRAINDIGQYFVNEKDDGVRKSLREFDPYGKPKYRSIKAIWSFGTGGLLQAVAIINSFIVLILIFFALCTFKLFNFADLFEHGECVVLKMLFVILLAIMVGFAIWAGQIKYAKCRYKKKEKESFDKREERRKSFEQRD